MYCFFDIAEERCRQFAIDGTNDDAVYYNLLQCQKKAYDTQHEKSNILPTGIYIIKRDNINRDYIESITFWNRK